MALIETLITEVAPQIAKSILRFWLKDIEWSEDITSGFADLIHSKTKDILARKRGERQFEEIGEKVVEALVPIFQSENRNLDEDSQTVVALAVAETFRKARIDVDLLVTQNLDPSTLLKHIIASFPAATQYLSDAETSLYKRVMSESCIYIVDISSQLPNFTERTFAEILSREALLISIVKEILEEIRRIGDRNYAVYSKMEESQFEKEYRLAVARNLDHLELFGLDISSANRRYQLSVAYITLAIRASNISSTSGNTKLKRPLSKDKSQWKENRLSTIPVDSVLMQAKRILIRGLAGSGKTTLLQWVAVKAATKGFTEQLSSWNEIVPFFIKLRQFVNSELPSPSDFPGLVAPAIAESAPQSWVQALFRSGRAIVLVDGVDEVPEGQRVRVRDWLIDLVGTYKQTRFVVTSRPSAIDEDWLTTEDFVSVELQPMVMKDVDKFVNHWHVAVQNELQDKAEQNELARYSISLKADIRRNRSLRNLATNPLLCAMLCALYRERRRQLPSDRIELYQAGYEMLVERRDRERGIVVHTYPSLSYRQKLVLLRHLAYWLLENGWTSVKYAKAEACIDTKLPHLLQSGSADIGAGDVLRLFVDRSGLIREPVVGQIDFAHRIFQEYLAAQEALERGNIGALIKNAHDDQWRETIILAAGMAKVSEREEIILGLISRGDVELDQRFKLHLLAVACLEASVELKPEVASKVQNRLSTIVPPRSIADAVALAAARELAVPYLGYKPDYDADISTACIHALSLIGEDVAIDYLETYAQEQWQEVKQELIKAWANFEPFEYARRCLWQLQELDREDIPVRDINLLASFTQLIKLNLRGWHEITSIEPLNTLNTLTILDLSDCTSILDISPLVNIPNLGQLSLRGCKNIASFGPLSQLASLSQLDLSECDTLIDLEVLENLQELLSLNLAQCTRISDLHSIARLEKLITLNISSCRNITSLRPLMSSLSLQRVQLYNMSGRISLPASWPERIKVDYE